MQMRATTQYHGTIDLLCVLQILLKRVFVCAVCGTRGGYCFVLCAEFNTKHTMKMGLGSKFDSIVKKFLNGGICVQFSKRMNRNDLNGMNELN